MIFHCFRKFGIGVFRRERDRYGFHAIGFAGFYASSGYQASSSAAL